MKQLDDFIGMLRLGTDAHDIDAHFFHGSELWQQVVDTGRLGLRAVKHQKAFALAGAHHESVRMGNATELAVVFGQVAVPRGKAARRKRQWHASVSEYLRLQPGGPCLLHQGQVRLTHFQWHDPAFDAQVGHPPQGGRVVNIEVRAGHKGGLAGHAMGRAHVIGFDHEIAIGRNLVQRGDIRPRLNQHLGRKNHFLACITQSLGEGQPVGQTQFTAARAHGFAQINDVDRRGRDGVVEVENSVALPVVQQWS